MIIFTLNLEHLFIELDMLFNICHPKIYNFFTLIAILLCLPQIENFSWKYYNGKFEIYKFVTYIYVQNTYHNNRNTIFKLIAK